MCICVCASTHVGLRIIHWYNYYHDKKERILFYYETALALFFSFFKIGIV